LLFVSGEHVSRKYVNRDVVVSRPYLWMTLIWITWTLNLVTWKC